MNFKHYSLLLLAGITYFTALAQPRIKDQGVIGGKNDDYLTSMYLTKDRGLIVGGYSNSNSSDQKTQNSRGQYDYWIVKLDSNRHIQWDKTIGGNSVDYLRALQQTTDGGYILGGSSMSLASGEKTEDSRNSFDYWIVKFDAAGNLQWDNTIGGDYSDELTALQQTADGGYIVGGSSFSNISGDKTENNKGPIYTQDFWMIKLDAGGNIQWDKTIGGSSSDNLRSLQQTADGGYILGGYANSNVSGDKTTNSKGDYDYWVVKLDASGNIQWDKTIGGGGRDILEALQQTNDGGYVLGGYSYSGKSGDKSANNKAYDDYWVVKLDNAGNIEWDKTIGGNSIDELKSLQQTTDGGYILSGYSLSGMQYDKTEPSRGGSDYWIVKINSQGKVMWDKTIGGTYKDIDPVVREIKKNNYVVGGTSNSKISGDKTGGTRGLFDYWLVELKYMKPDSIAITQLQSTNRLEKPLLSNSSIAAYPNPATYDINIQNKGEATFTLINQQGKVLVTKTIFNRGTMDISKIQPGIYFLVNATTGTQQKIFITR